MDQITLLKTQLELETNRRLIAEARLANIEALTTLRAEKTEQLHSEAAARFEKAREQYELYSGEHYRNGKAYDEKHQARHAENATRIEALRLEVSQLKAALAVKEKEVCDLKGGC